MATTSMVSPKDSPRGGEGQYGEVEFGDIAAVGWGRLWRRVSGGG